MTAEEIKQLRFSLSLTQEEFARKLKVAHFTVVRWESGTMKPNKINLGKLRNIEEPINYCPFCGKKCIDSNCPQHGMIIRTGIRLNICPNRHILEIKNV